MAKGMPKKPKRTKPAPGLLDHLDEERRQALRRLGWFEVGGLVYGRPLWRRPGEQGAIDEEQAFRELERLEQEESHGE